MKCEVYFIGAKPDISSLPIPQKSKLFFEDAAPVPNDGTFGLARKTKQSQIASFSALHFAFCQL
ncbi:MAG TPA: hypothetical protein VJ939_02555 [Bacteroidales bacterium]|nr:hypothetical protein [Bacteroidales bacterium]